MIPIPPDLEDRCALCGREAGSCTCPPCPTCGVRGDPRCATTHARLRFPKLAAALAEYDRTAPARKKLYDDALEADNMKGFEAALAAEEAARQAVCRAFNEDDLNPNSLKNNLLLGIKKARELAKIILKEDA